MLSPAKMSMRRQLLLGILLPVLIVGGLECLEPL
jgi:hypothetical protein